MSVASNRNFRAIRNALLVAASTPLVFAAAASAETAAATDGTVHFGSWGVDLNSRDTKANPGDDFERYASGHWMDVTEIPADKSQNGVGSEVSDRNQERLQGIVTSAAKDSQLGALYTSYMVSVARGYWWAGRIFSALRSSMGVVGLLVAMIINIFMQSSAMALAISAIGVLLFAGLTAYDTQKIKSMAGTASGIRVTSARLRAMSGTTQSAASVDFSNG